ncbi:MAG: hypothetical protein FJ253_01475 [Phycisphaerae bacterium]|nr:hypothetical protein [Phycisphaerae bacterium]
MQEQFAHGGGTEEFHSGSSELFHADQAEGAFLDYMARLYGPSWSRWMPDAVIELHWQRFLMNWLLVH